jgi:hypothetical protein
MTIEPPGNPNVVPDWWSPPGTVKKWCTECEHWFSSRGPEGRPGDGPGICPTCRKRIANGGTGRGNYLHVEHHAGRNSKGRFIREEG